MVIDSAQRIGPEGDMVYNVRLPDAWNASGRSGTWIYRSQFDIEGPRDQPWGLFIPRGGNRLMITLNGHLLGQLGRFDGDTADHAQRPHFFFISPGMIRARANELRVTVQGEKARYAGLSSMKIGPVTAVHPAFMWREAAQVWGSFAMIVLSIVFAAIALVVAMKLRDRSFAIFCAACLFGAVRTSYAVVIQPPIDYRLWSAMLDACYAGYLAALCLFCVDVLRLHRRWITVATTFLLCATLVLLPIYAWGRIAAARQALLTIMVGYGAALCVAVLMRWWRTRTNESASLAFAGAVSIFLAAYDHILVFYDADGYGAFAFARYSLIVFLIAMGVLLAERYARQIQREAELRLSVEREVRRRANELEHHFDQQQQLAAKQAHQQERQLLLQDLHDGMGLQLHGLLGLVQSGQLERSELTREVRTAIEQMRMLMDSADGFDGDISILLGDIRYRIEQRLQRAGIQLQWQAGLAHETRVLAPEHAIALQRLVFEWVTNTLKHSGATQASFQAIDGDVANGGLFIRYGDNGRGLFEGEVGKGMGSRSIDRRVTDLGATMNVDGQSAEGGLSYALWIPAAAFMTDAQADAVRIASSG